jgi:hypothetical protein
MQTKRDPMQRLTMHRLVVCTAAALYLSCVAYAEAEALELASSVTELGQIPRMRPEYPVPNEPNMLYYIQRSVNSNTVIYAAHIDSRGGIDPDAPVDAYWRWYNVDGHRKPLNLIERMIAYGVRPVGRGGPGGAVAFKVAGLPQREILVVQDKEGRPEALVQFGNRWTKLVYVYLQVDDSGLLPKVTAMDFFGIDKLTGKPLREHVIPH